jgi:hypothetical protein
VLYRYTVKNPAGSYNPPNLNSMSVFVDVRGPSDDTVIGSTEIVYFDDTGLMITNDTFPVRAYEGLGAFLSPTAMTPACVFSASSGD